MNKNDSQSRMEAGPLHWSLLCCVRSAHDSRPEAADSLALALNRNTGRGGHQGHLLRLDVQLGHLQPNVDTRN